MRKTERHPGFRCYGDAAFFSGAREPHPNASRLSRTTIEQGLQNSLETLRTETVDLSHPSLAVTDSIRTSAKTIPIALRVACLPGRRLRCKSPHESTDTESRGRAPPRTARYYPAGRRSPSVVMVNPSGPHHLPTCSESVRSFQTSSREASNVRHIVRLVSVGSTIVTSPRRAPRESRGSRASPRWRSPAELPRGSRPGER